jgi:DNA (cytosine-5)-methyltransferase 1
MDVREVRKGAVPRAALLAGGPPCQGFSKQKRDACKGDPRNEMVLEFARLVAELQPEFFLLENVDMLGGKRGRLYRRMIEDMLPGYEMTPHTYCCEQYGVAQKRKRFVAVGRKEGLPFKIPEPSKKKIPTVRDAISRFPEPPDNCAGHPGFPNHWRARVTAINVERFSHVPPGGGWQDIPVELQLPCHRRADVSKGGWPDVYGRLEWDRPAPTITGGFDSFTRGRYGHPEQDRPLTPREAAALQGFPDDFEFLGTRADVRKQIGNAVPPPLAKAIGRKILEALQEYSESA